LVLAIGIVVDDAIVVVEAVHAKMEHDPSLTPKAGNHRGNARNYRCYYIYYPGYGGGVFTG
jgi:Cu/Ag efflux pump CusA